MSMGIAFSGSRLRLLHGANAETILNLQKFEGGGRAVKNAFLCGGSASSGDVEK
ncbi:MAG: hypothetical protein XE07_0780 [Methanothrix harundinacea]|uniref:Uncharacterized protein n=1 Tax=Methanothrix harundinacea TaxID=301375 RepID=A0A101IKH2_9EURY|nr:MAG: hypothetical protein XE07_0780 [Methanothrix harundinacea]